jgi:aminopeptidase N
MILASPAAVPVTGDRTWSFEARDVRDVSLVLASDFEVATGDAGGIAVRAFTRPGGLDGDRLVAQAVNALTAMTDRLDVPYPWPAFTIVETSGGYGLESPGLIWIPSGTAPANIPYLVHHETAHQWFYGLVGSDQQAEPFADEAASDLLARTVIGALRGSRCDRAPLDRAIPRYTRACYYEVIYIQGANFLDDLRETMGTDRFWTALHDYLEANRFGLAGTRQVLEALRAASPVDLLPLLRARFPSLY